MSFYSKSNWGNLWGIKGPFYGPAGHRGHDIKAAARTAVPALRAGRVVTVRRSTVLGNVVEIQVATGDVDGYAHITGTKVLLGQQVAAGQTIGLIAGWSDFHGTSWAGPHLHLTNGAAVGAVFSGPTRNPAPIIEKVLAGQPALSVEQWKQVQLVLRGYGYGGPIDGIPGTATFTALQKFLAASWGYTGPIDGKPGTATWAAFNRYLNSL